MKTAILLTTLVLASFISLGQTIDTTRTYPSAKVVAFKNNPRVDSLNVGRVQILNINVNLTSKEARIYYQLTAEDGTVILTDTFTKGGLDYKKALAMLHSGIAVFFQYIGTYLKVTYQ